MKKPIPWKKWCTIAGVLLLLLGGAFIWWQYFAPNATPLQRIYLTRKLSTATKVVIRQCPKGGGNALAVITDATSVKAFIDATRITRKDQPCACFGFLYIEYHLASGKTFSLEYQDQSDDRYIRFPNPWGIQATPSKEFQALVEYHIQQRTGM